MPPLFFLALINIVQTSSFKETQLSFTRVTNAYAEKEETIQKYFNEKGLDYGSFNLFIRAFKREEKLEAWVKEKNSSSYTLLKTYDFCASSGVLGPKRKEGDRQIPEGVYHINHFNPESNFHLSLGINYPNASDKKLGDPKYPGSAIYIHGDCVTIGCIPITDDKIKELYVLAVEARNNGQQKIPVHIFPAKLDNTGLIRLQKEYGDVHLAFWEKLQTVYQDFEATKTLKGITIESSGEYVIR